MFDPVRVIEDSIDGGIFRAGNIGEQIITDHNRFVRFHIVFFQGKLKNLFRGFFMAGPRGSDYIFKIMMNA